MTNFQLIYFVLTALYILTAESAISDKRKCANPTCSEKISLAKSLISYNSPEEGILSFRANEVITVFSKSAGSNMDLWGVEINGKRGYVPKNIIREHKIFTKELPHLIDTEFNQQVPSDKSINPNIVDKIETIVVDGTTIYTNEVSINPSSTSSPGLATDVPQNYLQKQEVNLEQKMNAVIQEIEVKEKPVESEDVKQEEQFIESRYVKQEEKHTNGQDVKHEEKVVEKLEELAKSQDVMQEEKLVDSQEVKEEDKLDVSQGVKQKENPAEGVEVKLEEKAVEGQQFKQEEKPDGLQSVEEEVKPTENQDVKEAVENQEEKSLENQEEKSVENDEEKSVENQEEKSNENQEEKSVENQEEKPLENQEEKSVENEEEKPVENQEEKSNENQEEKSVENQEEKPLKNQEEKAVNSQEEKTVDKQHSSSIENKLKETSEEIPVENQNFVHRILPSQVLQESSVSTIPVNQEDSVPPSEVNSLNEHLLHPAAIEENTVPIIGNPILDQLDRIQNPMNAIFPNPLASQKIEEVKEVLIPKTENFEETNETINPLDNPSEILPKENVNDNVFSSNSKEESGKISFSYINGFEMNVVENITKDDEKKFEVETPEDFSSSPFASPTENLSSNDDLYYEEATESSYIDVPEPEVFQEDLEVTTSSSNGESVAEENLEESGWISSIMGLFGGGKINEEILESKEEFVERNEDVLLSKTHDLFECSLDPSHSHCSAQENPNFIPNDSKISETETSLEITFFNFQDLLVVLGISGFTVVVFLWGYMLIDKMKKEAPLIAKINSLEKALLVSTKENQLMTEKMSEDVNREETDSNFNAVISELEVKLEEASNSKLLLEEQVASLEKELENSTELGLELNKMLTDILKSQNGNETLIDNIEQLQKQLLEQQTTINNINTTLNEKDIENHELQLELEINNKKVVDLQSELDKMALNILEIEEDKEQCQSKFESELAELKSKSENLLTEKEKLIQDFEALKKSFKEAQRNFELKSTEYNLLKETIKEGNLEVVLDTNSLKAELQQVQRDNQILQESLQQNQDLVSSYDKQIKIQLKELTELRRKYDEADKGKLEAMTKLEVLGNYFKEKEAELQNELSKHESRWVEKQGEAISTSERIKFMQEELQNYKTQNGSLKQEIVSQEVELKSQISVLEKKAHENWVAARQAERKLDDAKQEAAQLRNRLTLRERTLIEDKSQNRLQSPLEMNGDHPLSPLHIDNPSSPPLLFNNCDLTTSPPLPGMPPFLPPPPGVPFMPPPLPGVPPFMPPPPSMFPGDHRPPPLGRRSSPPMNRYSPDSRAYSPYDRNSPSPSDDYYSPPIRGYSPYNGRDERDMRRDYKKPIPRRNHKGGMSSGSGNSNESLDNMKRHHSKV